MATRIAFTGGESILVAEDITDVVEALKSARPDGLPAFTRKAGHADPGTLEGQTVHVRPAAIQYVTTV